MPLQLGASSLAIATFDGREHGAMFDIGHRKPSAESETMSAIDPRFLTHLLVERGKPGIASCAIQRGMEFDIERDIALGVAFERVDPSIQQFTAELRRRSRLAVLVWWVVPSPWSVLMLSPHRKAMVIPPRPSET